MRLFDVVILKEDLTDYNLKAGAGGTIVDVLADGKAFLVEFMEGGTTLDVAEVRPNQIKLHIPFFEIGERVVLLNDLPDLHLRRDDIGEIVHKHSGGEVFDVRFSALDGTPYGVAPLRYDQIRRVEPGEIAHARRIKTA